eukprot:10374167-Alexandrium_andersonii.AAC.1
MAQTNGVPRGCDVIIQELASVNAPWRSTVIGDSTLACVEAKSNPEHPWYKHVTPVAMETFRNEPSIFAERGAILR